MDASVCGGETHLAEDAVIPSSCTFSQYFSGDLDSVGSCKDAASRLRNIMLCIVVSSRLHDVLASATAFSTAAFTLASLSAYGFFGGCK